MEDWSIRNLLNPVVARLSIYGVNPIDIEHVLSTVEKKNLYNVRHLEKIWVEEWEKKASHYIMLGEKSEKNNSHISAKTFFFYAAQCYYAIFLINMEVIEDKKRTYAKYSHYYKKSLDHDIYKVDCVKIPLDNENTLSGYFHYPSNPEGKKTACTVIMSGIGSCKEEMHTLARPLVERGIAVLVPDMPGNGESLLMQNVKCGFRNLKLAFSKAVDYLEQREDIRMDAIGTYGLCMGGGYAYSAACMEKRFSFCTTLFPLFINQIEPGTLPQWMKQGPWTSYQVDCSSGFEFYKEMAELEKGELECPYLFIHGKYDNWMAIQNAMKLFEKARGKKEKIIIEEEPVYSNNQAITHTMPVGEQLHWIRHIVADWMYENSR